MTANALPNFVQHYWGKADTNYSGDQKWHPLAYHSLDVAVTFCARLKESAARWDAPLVA